MRTPAPRGPKPISLFGPRGPRRLLGGCALALTVAGCDDPPQVRVYDAPADRVPASVAPTPGPLAADPADPANPAGTLTWDLPPGYRDTGESNSFRTATLVSGDGAVEVAISRVPGQAGSITANVNRWRSQLGLPPAGRDEVVELVDPAPTGADGLGGMVVTLANPDAPEPAAQRIAWFDLPGATWYVKASGTPAAVERETPALDRLLASLRAAEPDTDPAPAR